MLLIQTNANCERSTEAALTASYRACYAYFPKILTRRSHARRVDCVERPFIQRYGFVDGDWRTVRSCPGVSCVVASGDKVRAAADEIISREYDAVSPEGKSVRYVRLEGDEELSYRGLRPGGLVTISVARGLADFGVFKRMASVTRAVLLVTLLGAQREVEVPVARVRAA